VRPRLSRAAARPGQPAADRVAAGPRPRRGSRGDPQAAARALRLDQRGDRRALPARRVLLFPADLERAGDADAVLRRAADRRAADGVGQPAARRDRGAASAGLLAPARARRRALALAAARRRRRALGPAARAAARPLARRDPEADAGRAAEPALL